MKTLIISLIAGTAVVSAASAAQAQYYPQSQSQYQQEQRVYEQGQRQYERDLRAYEQARQRYDRDRAAWERRYGPGTYNYAPPPAPTAPYRYNEPQYGTRYPNDPYYGQPTYNDPYSPYRNSACERRNNNSDDRVAGTVIGALIGGALGAAAAGDSSEAEGAVLGAIVGGTIGNNITRDQNSAGRYAAQCDGYGYFYTFDQTFPYREGTRDRRGRSGQYNYDYYARQGCRLAIAPAAAYSGRADYRYVRVCPDRQRRYRITT